MKYPQISHDKKRNVKLKLKDIEDIRVLYNDNPSLNYLAKLYNVAPCTIRYWVDETYRLEKRKRDNERMRNRLRNDLQYYELKQKNHNEWSKHQYRTRPDFKAFNVKNKNEWRKNNPELYKQEYKKSNAKRRKVNKS